MGLIGVLKKVNPGLLGGAFIGAAGGCYAAAKYKDSIFDALREAYNRGEISAEDYKTVEAERAEHEGAKSHFWHGFIMFLVVGFTLSGLILLGFGAAFGSCVLAALR